MQNTNMPNDWKVKKLGEFLEITSCKRVHEADWTDHGVPFYRARELVALHDNQPIDPLFISEDLYLKNTKVSGEIQPGDLLVTGVGTIGVQYLVKPGDRFYFKDGNIIWLKNNKKIDGRFLYYSFDNWFIRKQILHDAGVGTVGTYTIDNAKKTKIMLPPIKEQEKIAEVLGTWDRAIEELTGLIAEKKELKRGLMQQLLTGTQRLPGFNKPWNNTKLGDIGIITSAGVDKKSIEGEKAVKLLNYMDVYKKDFLFASDVNMDVTASDRQIVNCNLKKGDVFFTPSSETRDDIAHSAVVMEDVIGGVYSYHIIRLRPTIEIDIKYTAYAFKTGMFYKQAYALCEGSGQRYVLSQNYFRNMKIYIPSDPAEQQAIADVLSKADSEIDLLNQQLNVLREQKRGLMQKLLTGEIRVKVDNE
jgi:type I restriction enzyme S subunit